MNIYKKISAAATIFAVAMMSSCSDKGYWDEAPLEPGLSFQCATYTETLGPGANEFVIPITRSVFSNEETVNITFTPAQTCPTDISVPSSVTFPAGSNTAEIKVTIANATPPYTYAGTLKFDGNASYSGVAAVSINCPVDYTWVSIGTGGYYDAFVMDNVEDMYSVEILKAEGFERYRVISPYKEYYATAGPESWEDWIGSTGPAYVEFWENEAGTLSFKSFATGLNYDGVSGDGINAYAWNEQQWYAANGDYDVWYQPGLAVLSPIYFIPTISGGFGQVQFAIQIALPE